MTARIEQPGNLERGNTGSRRGLLGIEGEKAMAI
jgi:hypothetical protein